MKENEDHEKVQDNMIKLSLSTLLKNVIVNPTINFKVCFTNIKTLWTMTRKEKSFQSLNNEWEVKLNKEVHLLQDKKKNLCDGKLLQLLPPIFYFNHMQL